MFVFYNAIYSVYVNKNHSYIGNQYDFILIYKIQPVMQAVFYIVDLLFAASGRKRE